jgi:hypothetical protein
MRVSGLSRRRLLQSLGGAVAAAPFARLLHGSIARAEASTAPKRLLLMFTPHGCSVEMWRPRIAPGGGFDFNFENATLAPLAAFQEKLTVVDGLDFRVLYESAKTGHTGGMSSVFTGAEPRDLGGGDFVGGGPSIDQAVANHLLSQGIVTPHKSIELGVGFEIGTNVFTALNFGSGVGSASRVQGTHEPGVAFTSVFGGTAGDDVDLEAIARQVARKRSLIDFARGQIGQLRPQLGVHEQRKLDAHLDGLRAIEVRMDALAGRTCGARVGETGASFDARDPENTPAVLEIMTDILAQSFACDMTRVATLQLLFAGSFVAMPWLDIQGDPHTDLAHAIYDGSNGCGGEGLTCDAGVVERYARMQRWYSEAVAMMLRKLDAIPEANGKSVLDNTIVVWGNELGEPSGHTNVNVPFVVAGGGDGALKMGQWLKLSQEKDGRCDIWPGTCPRSTAFTVQSPHNALLVSVARAFGMDVDTFGDARFSGALPGL